jgi:rhodanese-related sulfurtransferase
MTPLPTITPHQLDRLRHDGLAVKLIDTRPPEEFHRLHADLAVNVPLARLDPERLERERGPGEPLYVLGQSDTGGRQACERLRSAGCANVVQVEGGIEAWERAELPVVRDPETISLFWAWLSVPVLLALLVLIGLRIHPVLAMVLAMLLADPLLTLFAEVRWPSWGRRLARTQ